MKQRYGILGLAMMAAFGFALVAYGWWGGGLGNKVTYESASLQTDEATALTESSQRELDRDNQTDERTVVAHQPLPKQVKAVYMTACVVGTPTFRQQVVDLVTSTEVNSIVIDIKDYSGHISFAPENPEWEGAWQAAECGARDMREFIASLHKLGIYVIGRVTVFQDPFFTNKHPELAVKQSDRQTVWRDHKGLAFIDVAAKPYWEKVVSLSVDAYNVGFDELNYDYVRYPSDGNMTDIAFTYTEQSEWPGDKQANLEAFFRYLHEELSKPEKFTAYRHENTGRELATPYTSVDLFGMTATNHDDLSIGQVLERALPYFDAVAPMVYPSHYPRGFLGVDNPNTIPYRIVEHSMSAALTRTKATTTALESFAYQRVGTSTPAIYEKPGYDHRKLRTWIQDFNYGGIYGPAEVRTQIQASYDAGVMDWMIWDPGNRYTKAALKAPGVYEVE